MKITCFYLHGAGSRVQGILSSRIQPKVTTPEVVLAKSPMNAYVGNSLPYAGLASLNLDYLSPISQGNVSSSQADSPSSQRRLSDVHIRIRKVIVFSKKKIADSLL